MACDSDFIFCGKVIQVEKIERKDEPACECVTVEVLRTLKGAHAERVSFIVTKFQHLDAESCLKDKQTHLFFLVKPERAEIPQYIPPGYSKVFNAAIALENTKNKKAGTAGAFTSDLKLVTDPGEIVKRVQRTLAEIPFDGKVKYCLIHAP